MLLLGAILSDTVILNSPTTTERDHAVIAYLEQVLALDADASSAARCSSTRPTSTRVPAEEIVERDAKDYEAGGGQTLRIAQVETVGKDLGDRRDELLKALDDVREREGHALVALMVTDILAKGSKLYVSGERAAVERAFGNAGDGVIDLPGVMSRKKQVAPQLLAALAGERRALSENRASEVSTLRRAPPSGRAVPPGACASSSSTATSPRSATSPAACSSGTRPRGRRAPRGRRRGGGPRRARAHRADAEVVGGQVPGRRERLRRRAGADPRRPGLPVILVSADDAGVCDAGVRACGARAFVLKPHLLEADLERLWLNA